MGVSYVDIWMKSFPGRKKMISVKPLSRSVPGVYLWKQSRGRNGESSRR